MIAAPSSREPRTTAIPPTPMSLRPLATALAALLLCGATAPVHAWSDATRLELAERARRLSPPDLARQLARHRDRLRAGALDPRLQVSPVQLATEVDQAVKAVRAHRPFAELAERLGRISTLAAELNDPLRAGDDDPLELRFAADFPRYVDSARARFVPVFYGLERDLDRPGGVVRLGERALGRGRPLYAALGREYRRVGMRAGREAFDDRSTAFAVSAIAFSRALSDSAQLLRLVWLTAGGGDGAGRLPAAGSPLLRLAPATAPTP